MNRFFSWLPRAGSALGMALRRLHAGTANLRRRLLKHRLPDYVVIIVDQTLTERAPALPWWRTLGPGAKPPLSLESLVGALQRIADDPGVRGVLLLFKDASLSLSQAQSLSDLFARFRRWDAAANGAASKRIVVYLEQMALGTYVAACAADQVIVSPPATWDVLGFQVVSTFYKETLARLGVEFEVIKIAPWKTAFDELHRTHMSDEARDQNEWLLDSLYGEVVRGIAQGRRLAETEVRALIDRAPLQAEEARAVGLVDAVAYEDELPALLGAADKPARLRRYGKIHTLLLRRVRERRPRAVGVLSLEGSILLGESRRFPLPLPLFGSRTIGSASVQQQVRALRKDERVAAVVVHIDSGGGSAHASDLIWRELALLDREKPVVTYMGRVAASGGYYIALPGRKIVAQRSTLTGSIGVITGKPAVEGAFAKASARMETVQRGAHAGIYGADHWTEDERGRLEEGVQHAYRVFKEKVAAGRGLAYGGLDAVCSGKVWTGAQALDHGLVDALGDFQTAVELACGAAGLPTDGSVPVVAAAPARERRLAEPAAAVQSLLGLDGAAETAAALNTLLSGEPAAALARERFWLLALNLPRL